MEEETVKEIPGDRQRMTHGCPTRHVAAKKGGVSCGAPEVAQFPCLPHLTPDLHAWLTYPMASALRTISHIRHLPSPSLKQPHPPFHPSTLIHFRYNPQPVPIHNIATLFPTRDIYNDPSHPLYTRIVRRAAAFDATKLHWRVQCPVSVSGSGFVRRWVERRMRRAIIQALEQGGWKKDGGLIVEGDGRGLKGALLVVLEKDANVVLNADKEKVKAAAEWVVRNVVRLGKEPKERGTVREGSRRSKGRSG